ncbi:MAG TPA: hypothetical protein PLC17_10805, partial [Tenuifilaceae bacterium]|nr:hypothetical protein [Tenuifilaceae bacterium]
QKQPEPRVATSSLCSDVILLIDLLFCPLICNTIPKVSISVGINLILILLLFDIKTLGAAICSCVVWKNKGSAIACRAFG